MPKSDTPATRRSARVASKAAVPSKVCKQNIPPIPITPSKWAFRTLTVVPQPEPVKAVKVTKPKEVKSKESKAPKSKEPAAEPEPEAEPVAEPETAEPAVEEPKEDKKASSKKSSKGADKPASKDKKPPSSSGGRGALKEGQTLPKLTIEDNTGAEVDVSTLAGEKGVVIFLYPKVSRCGPVHCLFVWADGVFLSFQPPLPLAPPWRTYCLSRSGPSPSLSGSCA